MQSGGDRVEGAGLIQHVLVWRGHLRQGFGGQFFDQDRRGLALCGSHVQQLVVKLGQGGFGGVFDDGFDGCRGFGLRNLRLLVQRGQQTGQFGIHGFGFGLRLHHGLNRLSRGFVLRHRFGQNGRNGFRRGVAFDDLHGLRLLQQSRVQRGVETSFRLDGQLGLFGGQISGGGRGGLRLWQGFRRGGQHLDGRKGRGGRHQLVLNIFGGGDRGAALRDRRADARQLGRDAFGNGVQAGLGRGVCGRRFGQNRCRLRRLDRCGLGHGRLGRSGRRRQRRGLDRG